MVRGHTLQDKWEYRRKNDADSSDNEPNSTSSAEPVFKKLKQMSELMSNKSRKEGSNFAERRRARHDNSMQIVKCQKAGSRRMKRTLHVDERGSIEPATMSGNLLYMHSILEELRVAREKMIEWMRGEVQKLTAHSVPDLVTEEGSEWRSIKFKHQNGGVSMSNMHMHFPSTETARGSLE